MIRILILTDHSTHSVNNSIYGLAKALNKHPDVGRLCIVSRGCKQNEAFFKGEKSTRIWGIEHGGYFHFPAEEDFNLRSKELYLEEFDFIFLRLPRPVHEQFFHHLNSIFKEDRIINRPSGIIKTGNKSYLLNLQKFTAPIQLVNSFEEIKDFLSLFPVVLKPLEEYGGKGIIRIKGDEAEIDGRHYTLSEFKQMYEVFRKPYLAMKYLKNVKNGDKRIVVAGGEVLSASLRLPAEGGWLCNIAQGGKSVDSEPDVRELDIIAHIDPILRKEGIFYYGLDTLENDKGQRVISELNTLSIGGIVTPAHDRGEEVAKRFVFILVNYMKSMYE